MKRSLIVLLIISLLCSNFSSVYAANSSEIAPESLNVNFETNPSFETDLSFEMNPVRGSNILTDILSDISVTGSVYSSKPRGKFIIRLKNDYSVNRDLLGYKNDHFKYVEDGNSIQGNLDHLVSYYKIKTFESLNSISMELNTDEVNQLLAHPFIESVEEDKIIELASGPLTEVSSHEVKENSQTIPWGIHSIGAFMAQSQGFVGGAPIKVAVFDTGISDHPDLALSGGVSFLENDPLYNDSNGHGTHIAGTIAAINNDYGVIGASPATQLYSVKVIGTDGTGYTSSVLEGIQWAIDNGINIINMSFVTSQYSESLHSAIQQAEQSGILIVAAAGNRGAGENTIQYPANFPEVVAVGSIEASHHRSDFSSTGAELDLVAPGFGIISTRLNGEYGVASGTSNAAAHVSGAAALLWSHNRSLSAPEVVQLLKESATPLGDISEYGSGLVNVAKAIGVIDTPIAPLSDENLSGISTNYPIKQSDGISIASYDKENDGATVQAGSSVTVALKLEGNQHGENPHSQIIIEVYPALNPSQIIDTKVINNPKLHERIPYTWNVGSNTPTGTYHIKYRYPSTGSSNFDDIFIIYVIQPGPGPDTYEPNDTLPTAKLVIPGNSYISYISSSSDKDYYKFIADKNGEIRISLMIPPDVDYELFMLDSSGRYIGESRSGTGITENITLEVTKDQTYYIEVIGFSGAFSSSPYTLVVGNIQAQPFQAPSGLETVSFSSSIRLSWNPTNGAINYKLQLNGSPVGETTGTSYTFTNLNVLTSYRLGVAAVYPEGTSNYSTVQASTAIPELIVYQPEDIDSAAGTYQLFSFKPATTGVYKIFTGRHGGIGAPVDTVLGIYSNQQLTKLIAENDDSYNSVFSEIEVSLVAGQTYYVKISGYDTTRLRARVTAEVVSSTIPYIQLNQPVDINQDAGNSNVYVFVPPANGQYRITTSPFGGNSNSRVNDTQLSVFSNLDMETPISNGYNDDKRDSVYSEVVVNLSAGNPYYVRVMAAGGHKVYARLTVTSAGGTEFTALENGVAVDISKPAGEEAYFKFTPTTAGVYRFFTSSYQATPQLNDTEISIYSDETLRNLLDYNDDVKGYKPYGELFSKLEMHLNAGTTYYIVLKGARAGLLTRITVEDTLQSTSSLARNLNWNESIETNPDGTPLKISSLYDVDYYRIQLNQAEQVSLYLSDGEGTIEDSNGNIRGFFGKENKMNFELQPGIYYLKVEYTAIHDSARSPSWSFNGFNYELNTNINEITYFPGTYGEDSILRILNSNEILTFDATFGSNGKSRVFYENKKDSDRLSVEVFASDQVSIRKMEIPGGRRGSKIPVDWFGTIDPNLYNKNLYARSAFISYTGTQQYWAKSGKYDIVVFRMEGNKKKDGQSFRVTVYNDPINYLNVIPIPPTTINNRTIVASDINRCQECRNYFERYIYSPSGNSHPELAYVTWFQEMYGLTGLAKFWRGAERLVLCEGYDGIVDRFQCTLDNIGMIPVIGEGFDIANGVIYLIKGEYADALLSAASIIPFAGNGITGAKKFNKIFKHNPCGCLPAGTMIQTQDGVKPIEEIEIGDLVLAKDTDTGIQAYKPVEQLFSFDAEVFYILEVNGEQIRTTSNHPFWVTGKGWVTADELMVGDQLETENFEYRTIDHIDIEYNPSKVYNFTVEDFHTYYISEEGYLTHNLLDACNLNKYAGVVKTAKTKNLRKEIIDNTGITPPAGWEAHHIVAKGLNHYNADVRATQEILAKYKIDINSSANGVFLPKQPGVASVVIDGQTIATHNGGHSSSYFNHVYTAIYDAERAGTSVVDKETKILKAISDIRNDLLTGKLTIGKVNK